MSRFRNPPTAQVRRRAITALGIEGYKSLRQHSRIEVRQLTVLAGANSSGKSSALQPLLLMKQTLEAPYDPGPLLLDGPNVHLTSASQFLSKAPGVATAGSADFSFELRDGTHIRCTFKRQPKSSISLSEMAVQAAEEAAILRSDMTHDEVFSALPERYRRTSALWESDSRLGGRAARWRVVRDRCFLESEFGPGALVIRRTAFAAAVAASIRGTIHVPGLRGQPGRAYKTTAVGDEFPGTFENYVASIIQHWQSSDDERLGSLRNWLERLGLTWTIQAKQIDDTQVELRVGRLVSSGAGRRSDLVSIADVGFGVSQVLPVLVALLAARPGQAVYLEQPEIHLHPRAQSAMAEILSEAADRGVQVIVETHSALLLTSVQALVAEGKFASDAVRLHWFRRRGDGTTEVISGALDKAGAFGNWPEDFGETALRVESRFLDAAEARLAAS